MIIFLYLFYYIFFTFSIHSLPLDAVSISTSYFESIFDAVSSGLDNVVSLLGIAKNNSLENLDLVYCLDNQKVDKTSFETSRKLAKENQKIMVWDDDHFKDFNEILVYFNGDKTIIQNMILKNVYKGLEAYVRL